MMPSASPNKGTPSFGYHPDGVRIDVAFQHGQFTRALVLDGPVRTLATRVLECRILWRPDVELPEGIYWFQGIDEGALILQVAVGAMPGDATIAPLDQLDDNHPLMAAWAWAEQLWHTAAPVPAPLFEINEPAVTHPGDVDVG